MAREILLFLCHFSCEEVVRSLKNSHVVGKNINNIVVNKLVRTLKYIVIPKRSSILYFPIYLNRYDDLGG